MRDNTAPNEWDQRIREHSIWGAMSALGPLIDEAAAMPDLDGASFAGIERLRTILTFSGKRLAATDPFLAAPGPLDQIANHLTSSTEQLRLFISNRQSAHVQSANTFADSVLLGIAQLPSIGSSEELGELIGVVTKYREVIERYLQEATDSMGAVRTQTASLDANLKEHATSLVAEQTKLSQVISEFQRQFSEAQDRRGQEFTETQLQTQLEMSKVITEYQSQFSTAQESRRVEHSEAQTKRNEKFTELIGHFTGQLTEREAAAERQRAEVATDFTKSLVGLNTAYEENAARILTSIEEQKRRVEKLVGVIGNLGVTSGYLRTANHARRSMWFWQSLTVFAMIVLSLTAYYTLTLLEDSTGHFQWGRFAGRFLLLASVGVIAAYAGSQADKFFTIERRNRKSALELEAIGPYLAPLPEEERYKFLIQVGERSFGHNDEGMEPTKSPATILDLLSTKQGKDIIDLIVDVAKKGKAV